MHRRTALGLVGGALLPVAGCVGRNPTASPTPPDDPLVRAGPGDYPHEIYVHNAGDRDVTLTLTVARVGQEIYRRDHTVAADSGAVVAGITRRTLPEGDRRLTLSAVLPDGQSSAVEVDVTDCLGSVDFTVDSTGELGSTYSIC